MTRSSSTNADLPDRVSRLLAYEADLAFRRRARTVIEYIDPRPGERVLDAGCGLGFYLHLLGRLTQASVFGLELDAERLASARADDYAGRAALVIGDVARLAFADASFDKVIISEVLEHIPDDRAALLEVKRVLRPGGVCAVTVPNARYPFLWDPLNYARERLGLGHFQSEPLSGIWTDHLRLYEKDAIVTTVRDAGLEVTDVRLETRYSFPFSHQIVYGVGKYLLERGLAGRSGDGSASRFDFWSEESRLTPIRVLIKAFTAVDRFNRDRYADGSSVNICLRAVKAS